MLRISDHFQDSDLGRQRQEFVAHGAVPVSSIPLAGSPAETDV